MEAAKQEHFDILAVLLRPVVRYAMRRAIGVYAILEVLKSVYVELAREAIEESPGKLNVSRLSVMTGLQRKDVKRLATEGRKVEGPSNLVSRVVNRWEQDKRFRTAAGKPRVLAYQGENSEFEKLVKSVITDVGPAAILAELERLKLVERSSMGVRLLSGVSFYQGPPEKGLALLAHNVELLGRSVEENLFQPQSIRNLHLCTEYDNIFEESLPIIRQWLFEQGQLFHKHAREFLSQHDKDVSPNPDKKGNSRVSLVAFSWTEENFEKQ